MYVVFKRVTPIKAMQDIIKKSEEVKVDANVDFSFN